MSECDGPGCVTTPPRLVAPLSQGRVTTDRPLFRWVPPANALTARVEVCRDRQCAQPVTDFEIAADHARPPQPLGAGVYFWRVRGVAATGVPGPASVAWALATAGRAAAADGVHGVLGDVNGDGIGDVVVGAGGNQPLRVFFGGRDGLPATASAELMPSPIDALVIFPSLTNVGDVDGDGLGDFVAAVQGRYTPAGFPAVHWLYRGRAGTTPAADAAPIRPPTIVPDGAYATVAAHDANGDGYADVVLPEYDGASAQWRGSYLPGGPDGFLAAGGAVLAPTPSSVRMFQSYAADAVGDLDGDGYDDVLLSTFDRVALRRAVLVARGAPGGLQFSAPLFDEPTPRPVVGVSVAGLGDVNGDGWGDLVRYVPATPGQRSELEVLLGSEHGLRAEAAIGLPSSVEDLAAQPGMRCVAVGDVHGDGFDDVAVVWIRSITRLSAQDAWVEVFRGGPAGPSPASREVILNPVAHRMLASLEDGAFGASGTCRLRDVNGDFRQDLIVGAANATAHNGAVLVYLGGPDGLPTTPSQRLMLPGPPPRELDAFGVVVGP